MTKKVCLIGNPNSGKTTLFNLLTHSHQKVGNWAGVTVEKKEGALFKDKNIQIVDLPGLYSLSAISLDEKVVVDELKNSKPDLIINVIDGTNLERSLFLTLSLIKLSIPMIVAVNMFDELEKNKMKLNLKNLKDFLGVDVATISAKNNLGIDVLIEKLYNENKILPRLGSVSIQDIYDVIEKNIDNIIERKLTLSKKTTLKIDKVISHNFFGVIIFLGIMSVVYYLTVNIGGFLGDELLNLIELFSGGTRQFLSLLGANLPSINLIIDVIFKGIGSVLSFLPHLIVMFFLMTLLEESGYTARVSLIFDKFFNRFNLSGKSVIPFVLACGCTVSGIEACKVIDNQKERENTIFLAPFLPCGAKSAVFSWFSYNFFNRNPFSALIMYVISVIVLIMVAKILKVFRKSKDEGTFILELPVLRVPKFKDVFAVLKIKTCEFLAKSGTIIFAISIVVWLLSNFGVSGYTYGEITKSFLYVIGNSIKIIFKPLGFDSWQTSVSVFSGLLAKEAIVETLQIISSTPTTLFVDKYAVYSFMAFNLLCPPCVATLSVALRELKSVKKVVFMVIMEIITAYLVAFLINVSGKIFSGELGLIFLIIVGIIILAISIFSKKESVNTCKDCRKVSCGTQNNVRLHERIGNCSGRCLFSRRVDGR